jgi:GNAT superfamily N-acetyltransferase
MTGELLQEIIDRINIKVFNFDQLQTELRAKELILANKYFVYIATDNNEYVGFVSMYESYALYAEGAYGTIPELYVRPKYRSLSVGKQLLEQVKEFAKQKNWKRLEVTTPPLPEFDKTLSFYQKNSFEISGGKKLKYEI